MLELRSIVVHGSKRNVCGKRDYQTLPHVVLDAIHHVVMLATADPTNRNVSKLITELHAEARVRKAIAWLEKTSVPDT